MVEAGIKLIKKFESLHDGDLKVIGLQPKLCPAGIWTVGYGRALVNPVTHEFLKGDKDKALAYSLCPSLTEFQADQILKEDVVRYENKTDKVIGNIRERLNGNQYAAITSFVYNLGEGALLQSTLLKKMKVNPNDLTIKDEFLKWNKCKNPKTGVSEVLVGLTNRREAESILYFTK